MDNTNPPPAPPVESVAPVEAAAPVTPIVPDDVFSVTVVPDGLPNGPEISAGPPVEYPPFPSRHGIMLFCPHRWVEAVVDIAPEEFTSRGIQGVILDLDNTLVLWRKEVIDDAITAWLEALKARGIQLCILSNSVMSDRSARIAARLNCAYVRSARKPSRSGFLRALAAMQTTPPTTAVVGDQMFTDILGGNRVGLYTIMVKPIHAKEFAYTRYVSRPPERLLLRWYRWRGHL